MNVVGNLCVKYNFEIKLKVSMKHQFLHLNFIWHPFKGQAYLNIFCKIVCQSKIERELNVSKHVVYTTIVNFQMDIECRRKIKNRKKRALRDPLARFKVF